MVELGTLPASIGIQWSSAAEAQSCRRGEVSLVYCGGCGFIWNQRFDSSRLEYSKRYDNALDFSPVFQRYAGTLARRLVDTYGIREKRVVEIGCGKGTFLGLICEEGGNRGVGFDPSFEVGRGQAVASERIVVLPEFYSEKSIVDPADLLCSRHVFEHIADPMAFLAMIRRTIAANPASIVYFEVPNARFILEKLSIWDIIYEHCSYFSRESLTGVFRRSGFEILRVEESYGGQFLSVDARQRASVGDQRQPASDLSSLGALVRDFGDKARQRLASWRVRMEELRRHGRKCVVWGGGSKAVSFLSMVDSGDEVPYVVDINPHKQGLFIAGSGRKIVSPEFLREFQPDVVILMNPIYRDEVSARIQSMQLTSEILDA